MNENHIALSVFALSLAAAQPAHADAVKDFSTGTSVMVDVGTVVIGAPRTTSVHRPIAKARDTLDFAIAAQDLGMGLPVSVAFRGKALGGGWIEYTIDDTYPRPIDVGGGHYLSRIAGHVYMRAVPVRGAEQQTFGNTRLVIAGTNHVTAYGDWGEFRIPITELKLRGGVPQPALSRFSAAGGLVCSDNEKPTYFPLTISLAAAATASGTHVELKAPRDAGVRLPPGIVILPRHEVATIGALIQPRFAGTVRVTASAGGVVKSLDLVVHPSGDCVRR